MLRLALCLALLLIASRAGVAAPALVPVPLHVIAGSCGRGISLQRPLRFAASVDAGGFDIVRARWTGLGVPAPLAVRGSAPDVAVAVDGSIGARVYRLTVDRAGIRIAAGAIDG